MFTGRALLHQRGETFVKAAANGQILPLRFTRTTAAAVSEGTRVSYAASDGFDMDPAFVLRVF